MRRVTWLGRLHVREVTLLPVAFCICCGSHRLLSGVQKWEGWPEGEAPIGGQCVTCGCHVTVASRAPEPGAA